MNRRTLLAAVGGSVFSLAGCVGDQTVQDDSADWGTDPDDTDGNENGVASIEGTIETTSQDCGDPTEEWVLAFEQETDLAVEGTTPVPDPCREARLGDISLEDGDLQVDIEATSTLDADEDCPACAGVLTYEATVDTEGVPIESVSVAHVHGQTHHLQPSPTDAAQTVQSAEIEVVDTQCGERDDVDVHFAGPRILVNGSVRAPNPCHDVELDRVAPEENRLVVEIGLVSTLEEDEVCIECVGQIDYTAELTTSSPLEEIVIDHADHETYTIHPEEAEEGG